MEMYVKFSLNDKLYLRDPEESEIGKKILEHSVLLIHELGFETFTFKKLGKAINTTEASIYRYFENKHRLLLYIVDWYWSWQEYRLVIQTQNLKDPEVKIRKAIQLISSQTNEDITTPFMDEKLLYEIVMQEGAKSYLTRHVTEDNKAKLFKPYKDLTNRLANMILEYNPDYKFPRSLSSTVIEMAHSQNFYMRHLPSLTDFGNSKEGSGVVATFLEDIVFKTIQK